MQGRKSKLVMFNHELVHFPYDNGCHLYPDCFTCPGPPQCVVQYGANKKEQGKVERIWKPLFERELSRMAAQGGR